MTEQEYRKTEVEEKPQEDFKTPDISKKSGREEKRRTLTGSFPAKVAAFFLLAASSFVAAASVVGCICALAMDMYSQDSFPMIFTVYNRGAFIEAAYNVRDWIDSGKQEGEIRHLIDSTNFDVDILWGDAAYSSRNWDKIIWGTNDGTYETDMTQDFYLEFQEKRVDIGGNTYYSDNAYLFRVYIKPEFISNDYVYRMYQSMRLIYELRYVMIWSGLAGCILTILCFLFLMCSAGHNNRRREEQRGDLPCCFLDVLAAVFLLGIAAILFVEENLEWQIGYGENILEILLVGAAVAAVVVWLALCLHEAARCIKRGKWWRHTLIRTVFSLFLKLIKLLGRCMKNIFCALPAVLSVLIIYFGLVILEFLGCLMFMEEEGVVLWALEKVILLPVILYVAITCVKLLRASEALADGEQDYVVDTSKMFGDFKAHGENLNSIGQGISKAVAERMKSEHLKTELITNVSHDLKTPLTSIINYSGLICEEKTDNEKITEYAQVLFRQSGRLKKLLEDLLEASKATTGNLEVNLAPCEVGVILSQAVGEYLQKLEEKDLDLISSQPEEPVQIMADGKHLWRVFDNLLNNICKYAQENSRVYLSVELREGEVFIIFRNMSKYPLNISTEELEERFVRGDKSRHMEGNGLGLSIARSLMDLQNGKMEIVTDGDLFKVTLKFRQLS